MEGTEILSLARNCMEYLMPEGQGSIHAYSTDRDDYMALLALPTDEYIAAVKGFLDNDVHFALAKLSRVPENKRSSVLSEQFLSSKTKHLYRANPDGGFPIGICKKELLQRLTAAKWLNNKQVFSVSSELCQSLMTCVTEDGGLDFYLQSLDHLPFNAFCIDLADVPKRYNAMGFVSVMVGIHKDDDHLWIYMGFIDKYNKIINDWATDFYDEMRQGNINPNERALNLHLYDKKGLPTELLVYLIFSIMMYLSSERPDVTESPKTKSTYRKPVLGARVKNAYREIQKWDVGVRYGQSVKSQNKASSRTSGKYTGEGSPKRPHIRRAHWHHYWVGKGREVLIVKWLDPILINVTFDSELPVVVHQESL